MGTDGNHIRPQRSGGKADFSEGLHRIRMGNAVGGECPHGSESGFYVIEGAAFVIDQHKAGKNGSVGVLTDKIHIEGAASGGHPADGEAVRLQPFHTFLHGGMLAVRGEDLATAAVFFYTALGVNRSHNGQLIRLGSRGGEDHPALLFPTDAQGTGHRPAALLQHGSGADAHRMDGGRIAPRLSEGFCHLLDDGGIGCGGGAVIEIDFIHHFQRKLSRMAVMSSV